MHLAIPQEKINTMATENKENTELLSHDDSNAEDFKVGEYCSH
jgi:hypothetical protein